MSILLNVEIISNKRSQQQNQFPKNFCVHTKHVLLSFPHVTEIVNTNMYLFDFVSVLNDPGRCYACLVYFLIISLIRNKPSQNRIRTGALSLWFFGELQTVIRKARVRSVCVCVV